MTVLCTQVTPDQRHMRRCSTMELQYVLNNTEEHKFDMVEFECEYASSIPPETSCFVASDNSSTMGPGLDSDFGASAGELTSNQIKCSEMLTYKPLTNSAKKNKC